MRNSGPIDRPPSVALVPKTSHSPTISPSRQPAPQWQTAIVTVGNMGWSAEGMCMLCIFLWFIAPWSMWDISWGFDGFSCPGPSFSVWVSSGLWTASMSWCVWFIPVMSWFACCAWSIWDPPPSWSISWWWWSPWFISISPLMWWCSAPIFIWVWSCPLISWPPPSIFIWVWSCPLISWCACGVSDASVFFSPPMSIPLAIFIGFSGRPYFRYVQRVMGARYNAFNMYTGILDENESAGALDEGRKSSHDGHHCLPTTSNDDVECYPCSNESCETDEYCAYDC